VIYEIASAMDAADLLQREYEFMRANACRDKGAVCKYVRCFLSKSGLKGGGQRRFTGATALYLEGGGEGDKIEGIRFPTGISIWRSPFPDAKTRRRRLNEIN